MRTSQKSSTWWPSSVPIVALGLPIADTFLAIVRRVIAGRPILGGSATHPPPAAGYGPEPPQGCVHPVRSQHSSRRGSAAAHPCQQQGGHPHPGSHEPARHLGLEKLAKRPTLPDAEIRTAADAGCRLRSGWPRRRTTASVAGAPSHGACLGISACGVAGAASRRDTIIRSTSPNGDIPLASWEVAATDVVLIRMDYCRSAGVLDASAIEPLKERWSRPGRRYGQVEEDNNTRGDGAGLTMAGRAACGRTHLLARHRRARRMELDLK